MARADNEKALLAYIKALQELVVCYRLGRAPSNNLFDRLARGEKFVRTLSEVRSDV